MGFVIKGRILISSVVDDFDSVNVNIEVRSGTQGRLGEAAVLDRFGIRRESIIGIHISQIAFHSGAILGEGGDVEHLAGAGQQFSLDFFQLGHGAFGGSLLVARIRFQWYRSSQCQSLHRRSAC